MVLRNVDLDDSHIISLLKTSTKQDTFFDILGREKIISAAKSGKGTRHLFRLVFNNAKPYEMAKFDKLYRYKYSYKVECPCGSSVVFRKRHDHCRTKKHLKYEDINECIIKWKKEYACCIIF